MGNEESFFKKAKRRKKMILQPVQILAIGFALVILIGAIILTLPISSAANKATNFVDCLFTSTSSVCVTGLITKDTATYWSTFGQCVIIILIQVGGLGFMSFATLVFMLVGKKITLKERLVMQEAMNSLTLQGLVKMTKYILIFTFSIEGIGVMILATQFIPDFGLGKGIAYSVFHAISAFCNAGFDLMGNFSSLTSYYDNSVVIMTISFLIISGGLGFYVWNELYHHRESSRFTLHTKLVLITTFILIVGGAIFMFVFERNNVQTLGPMNIKDKVVNATFASVSPRTAGFNSIALDKMTVGGKFLTTVLMFIGGSPGSTAGGIKTTTLIVLIFAMISTIRCREDVEICHKRITKDIVYKAILVAIMSFLLIISATFALAITEHGFNLEQIVFEVVSAFGTVGLTLGITPELSSMGKIVIAICMYFGRLGPLTIILAFSSRRSIKGKIKYPEEKILVG
ncbi:trk system potassium uptake protein TrkH [Hathewaya proteolytica DSM 3090]|uniref:Trk system potassium uptake protein TrkH n=1 Tax=Hathewaya proteolytica DSM 3090 TaxID=1121331 RepID=A0A1M6QS80_9CLOT|nr:trk system potassium uptake protein TrkH [Hathewaya proteolytica DSM 3090]